MIQFLVRLTFLIYFKSLSSLQEEGDVLTFIYCYLKPRHDLLQLHPMQRELILVEKCPNDT